MAASRAPFVPTIAPWLYEVLWRIAIDGPLTAGEIAASLNQGKADYQQWSPQAAANRMRTLVRLGLLERDDSGIYALTDVGRAWMNPAGIIEAARDLWIGLRVLTTSGIAVEESAPEEDYEAQEILGECAYSLDRWDEFKPTLPISFFTPRSLPSEDKR